MSVPTHGKPGTYTNHRCRCSLCREAWRLYVATYRVNRAANTLRAQQMEQERK